MKRIFVILLMVLAVSVSLFADSFYSVGAAAGLNSSGSKPMPAGGVFFDTYYAYPQEGTSLSHGFGTLLECALPGFHQGALVNFVVGYALEWKAAEDGIFELYMLTGPSLSCHLGRDNGGTISIGGGVELNGSFFFNKERTLGLSVGIKGLLEGSSFHSGDMSSVKPVGTVGAHVGFAMKIKPSWENLPSHSYTPEHDIDQK